MSERGEAEALPVPRPVLELGGHGLGLALGQSLEHGLNLLDFAGLQARLLDTHPSPAALLGPVSAGLREVRETFHSMEIVQNLVEPVWGKAELVSEVFGAIPYPEGTVANHSHLGGLVSTEPEKVVPDQIVDRVGVAQGAIDHRSDLLVAPAVLSHDVQRQDLGLSPLCHEALPAALSRTPCDPATDVDAAPVDRDHHLAASEDTPIHALLHRLHAFTSRPQGIVGDEVGQPERCLVVHLHPRLAQQRAGRRDRVRLAHRVAHQQPQRWGRPAQDAQLVQHWIHARPLGAPLLQPATTAWPRTRIGRHHLDGLARQSADRSLAGALYAKLDTATRSALSNPRECRRTASRLVGHRLEDPSCDVAGQFLRQGHHRTLGGAERLCAASGLHLVDRCKQPPTKGTYGVVDELWVHVHGQQKITASRIAKPLRRKRSTPPHSRPPPTERPAHGDRAPQTTNRRLDAFLGEPDSATARTVYDWRAWTGSPGLVAAAQAMGPAGLVEREHRMATWTACRLGELAGLQAWLEAHLPDDLPELPPETHDDLREACLTAGCFRAALRWGELEEDDMGPVVAVPLPPGERADWIARFAQATAGLPLDLHGLALVDPSEAVDGVRQLDGPGAQVEYCTGLLLPPDRLQPLMEAESPDLGFGLRLACYTDDPSVRERAVAQVATGSSMGMDCLCALTDPFHSLGPWGSDAVRDAHLLAWAWQGGRPRPAEVERSIRAGLADCAPNDPLLGALSGLSHRGWPELLRLARMEEADSVALWMLAGQGPTDQHLYEVLLALHSEDPEVLFRHAPAHRLLAAAVRPHVDQAVQEGVPDDEADKLLFCLCLDAAASQELALPRPFLRHLALESDAFDLDIAKALLRITVSQAPDLTEPALARMDWPRSTGFLRYALVPAWLHAPPGTRGPLLTALCHNEEPTMAFPRPGLFDEADLFAAFAVSPPTSEEWAHAAGHVERHWRAVLAPVALALPDPEPALQTLEAKPLEPVRRAARKARVRWDELREVGSLIAALAADPARCLEDRTALHLAWRLDALHGPDMRSLLASPAGPVRRAAWWVMEATPYAPDVERWP